MADVGRDSMLVGVVAIAIEIWDTGNNYVLARCNLSKMSQKKKGKESMRACCEFCYEKYINADNTIDQEVIRQFKIKYPTALKEDTKRPLCMCKCHVKGYVVFH